MAARTTLTASASALAWHHDTVRVILGNFGKHRFNG
jgi:hypothetical protein